MITLAFLTLASAAPTSTNDKVVVTIVAAVIPAMITLVGTLWQIYARRPLTVSKDGPMDQQIQVLRLTTDRPPTTVHPWFALAMVVWHVAVAVTLLALASFEVVNAIVLGVVAGFYVLGALVYGWEYYRVRGTDPSASAEIVVEADPHALFTRCRASLANASTNVTTLDRRDPGEAIVEARASGALLRVVIAPLGEADNPSPAQHPARRASMSLHSGALWAQRYRVSVRAQPTRWSDGLPRAIRSMDAFLLSFLA